MRKWQSDMSSMIVVTLDCADAGLLHEWQESGYLPALSGIMRQGCWGQITGDEYLTPHGLWMSFYSGATKAQHGFYHYRQLIPDTYTVKPHDIRECEATPFWSAVHSAGGRIAVLDVPETYPVPGLNGFQLANFRIHNSPGDPVAAPASFLQRAIDSCGERQVVQEKANSTIAEDRKIYSQLLNRIKGTGKFCSEILNQEHPDCTIVGFSESHIAGHQFWKYRDSHTEMRDAIRNIYREIDNQLDLILQTNAGTSDLHVISNTGIQDQTPARGLWNSFCESLGYQVRPSGPKNTAKMVRFFRGFIPEKFQAYLMFKVSAEARQRILSQIYSIRCDWSRTTAFVLPASYTGMIRINLKDREPFGIVEAGKEYEELLDQLEADLLSLIDPLTGENAVMSVCRPSTIYQSGPPAMLPDIITRLKPSKIYQETLLHPRATIRQKKPGYYRQNNHTDYGFFASCGPSIQRKGRISDASITEFAPELSALKC